MEFKYIKDGEFFDCTPGCPEYNDPALGRVVVLDSLAISQQRPRARIIEKGKKSFVQMYSPTSNKKTKLDKVAAHALGWDDIHTAWPFLDESHLFVVLAVYPPYKSWTKKMTQEMMYNFKVTKPDSTNICKFYEDWLQGWFCPTDQYLQGPFCVRMFGPKELTVVASIPLSSCSFRLGNKLIKTFNQKP